MARLIVSRKKGLALIAAVAVAAGAVAGGIEAGHAQSESGAARGTGLIRLIMVEEPGCPHCARWHREIGPAYPASPEGRFAPLERVSIDSAEAHRLGGIRFSPTFIAVKDRVEVGRIVGYPGVDFFWPMLDEVLARAGYRADGSATGEVPKT